MPREATGGELFGHPRGLWVLAGTELWDRVSYHAMQSLLTLYMAGELFARHAGAVAGLASYRAGVERLTGPLSAQAFAIQTFGLYSAFVSFTPVFGGLLGDRLTGRRPAIIAGLLLMTAGHFSLAFDRSFLMALVLLILGAGLIRGNLSAQIRALYADGDRRNADAFQVYFLAINCGAFVAPIISGLLAARWGWHAGFTFAGAGMLVGLAAYLTGGRHLPPDAPRQAVTAARAPGEWRVVAGLAMVWPVSLAFWFAQSQIWSIYTLWVRDHVERRLGGFTVPVPWLSALDGLAPVLWMPLVVSAWHRLAARGREPDYFTKASAGCVMLAAGIMVLALAAQFAGGGKVALIWPVIFHIVANLGWVCFAPTIAALWAARAPERMRGALLGINVLAIFAAQILSGRMGILYERMPPAHFWAINALIAAAAGVILALMAPALRRRLGGA